MKILLADDDVDLTEIATYALRRAGFEVLSAADGAQALRRWESDRPDLILLDIGLPRISGLEVCRRVRQSSRTPVIMLTARGDEEHVVQGFLAGADDYVTKPVSYRELALRIRAVLQRASNAPLQESTETVHFGPLQLNRAAHEVTVRGRRIHLTPLEFRILDLLAVNQGRLVTTARIIEHVWGYQGGDSTMLKTHVSNIRQKLRVGKGEPGYLTSVPRVGYYLAREEPTADSVDSSSEVHVAPS